MEKTTIQVNKKTLDRLQSLRRHPRESYDELLNAMMDEKEGETLSPAEIDDIKRGLDDIKSGRIHTLRDLAKEYGIKL